MTKVTKISIESDDLLSSGNKKDLLPDLNIDQLFDLDSGITVLFSQLSCSQGTKATNPEVMKDEWWKIYQVAEFQLKLQQEIKNRIPAEITEMIDLQLNKGGE